MATSGKTKRSKAQVGRARLERARQRLVVRPMDACRVGRSSSGGRKERRVEESMAAKQLASLAKRPNGIAAIKKYVDK